MAFDEDAALHYVDIRAELKRRVGIIGANDLIAAAYAGSLGLTVVTNSMAVFERVAKVGELDADASQPSELTSRLGDAADGDSIGATGSRRRGCHGGGKQSLAG